MNVCEAIDISIEGAFFLLSLVMLLVVEVHNRRKQRERANKITDFRLRNSITTTDSFVDNTDVLEFIRQNQISDSKIN